jgi:hypothetical protein
MRTSDLVTCQLSKIHINLAHHREAQQGAHRDNAPGSGQRINVMTSRRFGQQDLNDVDKTIQTAEARTPISRPKHMPQQADDEPQECI